MASLIKHQYLRQHFIQKCTSIFNTFKTTFTSTLIASLISISLTNTSQATEQNISQNNTKNTQQNETQKKITLLFSDAFIDKENNLPMPERYYKLIKQIEEGLNIEFSIQLYPWNRAVNIATTQGELIFALSQTPERLALFTFSEPILYNYIWLVTRADKAFSYNKIKDLKGKTIDIFRGAKYGGDFDKNKNILFKIEEGSGSYSQRLLRLQKNRVDAMVFSSEHSQAKDVEKQINDIVKNELQQNKEDTQYNFKVIPIPITKDSIRFAILKGSNEQLITNINQFIKKLQNSNNKTP